MTTVNKCLLISVLYNMYSHFCILFFISSSFPTVDFTEYSKPKSADPEHLALPKNSALKFF